MNLVEIKNNQPVTTSLQVAEYFEKEHKNVLQAIRELNVFLSKRSYKVNGINKAENSALLNQEFHEDKYKSKFNKRNYPMFYMTERGFTLLVMGFNTDKALEIKVQFLEQFELMKEQLNNQPQLQLPPHDYATALRGLANQVELNEKLRRENERLTQLQPTSIEQTSLMTDVLYTTEEIALGIGYPSARALNKRLNDERILYYQKGLWRLYAPYAKRGFKDMSTRRNSQLWTEKGKEFIENKFKLEV